MEKSPMLTAEEQRTLESYKKIAAARGKTHADPEFWRAEFEKFKELLPKGRVVDIGCGSGRDAILFAQGGYDYIGIDLSNEMIAEAKKLVPSANFQKMSMYNFKFSSGSFDGFWAAASLLHIPKKNIGIVLQEIKRILKPGGIGFIALKWGEGERMVHGLLEGDERFFAFYKEPGFTKVLLDSGFEILEHARETHDTSKAIWISFFVRK